MNQLKTSTNPKTHHVGPYSQFNLRRTKNNSKSKKNNKTRKKPTELGFLNKIFFATMHGVDIVDLVFSLTAYIVHRGLRTSSDQ